ncbi:hypothetical protein EU99_0885 [Prochlorococcus marinus str. MIT 9321]|uniref:Uncharacterized protein n=1 Tax=Prochlorococcus marinus str. MIT 9401 TaxID=167551 RepID=A0A0A2B166_PROMR|nr:hypothetical protein EU99_0885 [Prochlorococcus marinus str. MIT 9321]KGG05712.1 hypothetical protein EV00_0794 [Prochlorococcus marinus str. MIT 9322]KGG07833.1 hypothetical protein EV01_0910 [Prochlorococcus marinus str. MIT 9401]
MKNSFNLTNFRINNFLGIKFKKGRFFNFSRNIYVNYKTTLGG